MREKKGEHFDVNLRGKVETEKEKDTTSCQILRQPFLSNPSSFLLIRLSLAEPDESPSVSHGPLTLFYIHITFRKTKRKIIIHKRI